MMMDVDMRLMTTGLTLAVAGLTAVTAFNTIRLQSPPPISVAATPIETKEFAWKCPGCTPEEQYVLKEIQARTKITDRNALATLLGNIKQESNFRANICEGGTRVPYHACHRGGYGLIQWTSVRRYKALGNFCENFGCDPSTLEGQVRFMINETTFQRYLPEFEGRGHTISQYMVPAYYWLGWGIKGYRELYAHQYYAKLTK